MEQPREHNWGATWYKSSGSCLEKRECGRRDPSRWPRGTLSPQKLAITSLTSGGRSVGIVRSRTQTMEIIINNNNVCNYVVYEGWIVNAKVNVSVCLTYEALCHEDVRWEWTYK
jgi:hypothetical protein